MYARSLVLLLVLSACASSPDGDCVGDRRIALNKLSANKLATNAIATNRIALNGLLASSIPDGPLTSGSLAHTLAPEVLEDAFTRDVLEYMVSCALEPGQRIEVAVGGDVLVYEGALGLAPQWGTESGSCDAECRGWVSACLIARTNFLGESVPISLLGDHERLAPSADESLAFDVEEATYFGDLFGEDRTLFACVPAGSTGPERTCGDDPSSCAIAVLGECDSICDDTGCRDAQGIVHAQTITVKTRDPSASCE